MYRDLKAVTDTAYGDGYKEAESTFSAKLEEEKRQKEEAVSKQKEAIEKQKEAIILLLSLGISSEQISEKLSLPLDYIESLKNIK